MSEDECRYDVVFCGAIKPGMSIDDAKSNLAKLFNADPSVIGKLFFGGKKVLKRGVSAGEAEKYRQAFDRAGAVLELERVVPPVPEPPHQTRPTTTSQLRNTSLIGAALAGLILGASAMWGIEAMRGGSRDEHSALVRSLQSALTETSLQLDAIEAQLATPPAREMLALLQTRQEIMKTTLALIEQRIHAIESHAPVQTVTPTATPDPEAAKTLEAEIAVQEEKLKDAKRRAQDDGGPADAVWATTVATQELAVAALRLRYLSAKYGLPGIDALDAETRTASSSAHAPATGRTALSPAIDTHASDVVRATTGHDGAFGLHMGLSADQIGATEIPDQPGRFLIRKVPEPHPLFETFIGQIGPKSGLCRLRGVGIAHQTDSHGAALQAAFNRLESELDAIYGPHKRTDLLVPGSLWPEPEYWMHALGDKQRFLLTSWTEQAGASLGEDLVSVAIFANALSSDLGQVNIEYSFRNEALCDAELSVPGDAPR